MPWPQSGILEQKVGRAKCEAGTNDRWSLAELGDFFFQAEYL